VVPGQARLLAEARAVDPEWLTAFGEKLSAEVIASAAVRGVEVDVTAMSLEPPTPMTAAVSELLTGAAGELGHPITPLASFAGHDAVMMAHLGPAAMLFVPSHEGRSHCPEEWTDGDDIAVGVHALAQALTRADRHGLVPAALS
jgi:beta-ureidopropionase / N-carbamoyl-L-amino-acid hydrolase